jgi:hypothetical protein
MELDSLASSLLERGFVVVERHLDDGALARTLARHEEALARADPRDISLSSSGGNARLHLVDPHPDLDRLHLDPILRSLAARVMKTSFRLGAFLSRSVQPGAGAQELQADLAREGDAANLIGFIYMLDDFRADNGATRFVPGSHRGPSGAEPVLAIAPAGSLIVYDGAVLHGFTANRSSAGRRSIQGSLIAAGA